MYNLYNEKIMNNLYKIVNEYFIKKLAVIFIIVLVISSCGSINTQSKEDNIEYSTLKLESNSDDSLEYDIIIDDIGYESFLIMQKPMSFYSQRYYENWNRYYVSDWNLKVGAAIYHSTKYQNVFDMYIDYDPTINYGMLVNYKLYYYFRFVENRYGVRFRIPRAIHY